MIQKVDSRDMMESEGKTENYANMNEETETRARGMHHMYVWQINTQEVYKMQTEPLCTNE